MQNKVNGRLMLALALLSLPSLSTDLSPDISDAIKVGHQSGDCLGAPGMCPEAALQANVSYSNAVVFEARLLFSRCQRRAGRQRPERNKPQRKKQQKSDVS